MAGSSKIYWSVMPDVVNLQVVAILDLDFPSPSVPHGVNVNRVKKRADEYHSVCFYHTVVYQLESNKSIVLKAPKDNGQRSNPPAASVSYYTPARYPPAGTAINPQSDIKFIPTLFQPIKIRGVEFQNCIFVAPLCQFYRRWSAHSMAYGTSWRDAYEVLV